MVKSCTVSSTLLAESAMAALKALKEGDLRKAAMEAENDIVLKKNRLSMW